MGFILFDERISFLLFTGELSFVGLRIGLFNFFGSSELYPIPAQLESILQSAATSFSRCPFDTSCQHPLSAFRPHPLSPSPLFSNSSVPFPILYPQHPDHPPYSPTHQQNAPISRSVTQEIVKQLVSYNTLLSYLKYTFPKTFAPLATLLLCREKTQHKSIE